MAQLCLGFEIGISCQTPLKVIPNAIPERGYHFLERLICPWLPGLRRHICTKSADRTRERYAGREAAQRFMDRHRNPQNVAAD